MSENKWYLGSFNKAKNYKDSDLLKNDWGFFYDKTIYERVSKEIKAILGEKKKYTGKEAFRYFQHKYAAYPIDIRYYYNYMNTRGIDFGLFDKFTVSTDDDIESLNDLCGSHFTYIGRENNEEKERTLTFVIDITGNPFLREQYPQFDVWEEEEIQKTRRIYDIGKDEESGWWIMIDGVKMPWAFGSNIIVAIGSLDGKSINSMKVLLGAGDLPEVEYALEFFRRHS